MLGLKHKMPEISIRDTEILASRFSPSDITLELRWGDENGRRSTYPMQIFCNGPIKDPLDSIYHYFRNNRGRKYDLTLHVNPSFTQVERFAGMSVGHVLGWEADLLMDPRTKFIPQYSTYLEKQKESGTMEFLIYPLRGDYLVVAFSTSASTPSIDLFFNEKNKEA